MISRLRAISGRPFSEASPVLDMDLGEFHTRVSVIGNPLSRGLAYAFRRHKKTPWTLPQLIHNGMLSPYAAGLLSMLVDGQSSLLVTGSRGAGKTSLLSALMLEIPQSYRLLVIEDTPELPVEDMQRYGWKAQAMGTRASVSGSEAEFQASDVLRAALRLGESALVIGEVRGAEAKSLYEAMRIGASGNSVMGTIHGASCRDVFDRVVHDIGVPAASFRATDAVVVCSTVRAGGGIARERRVVQLSEVSKGLWDDEDGAFNDLLSYDVAAGALVPTDRIDTGRSEALQAVAKKWGLSIEEASREVVARAAVRKRISDAGSAMPGVMEVGAYARSVNVFRVICEKCRDEHGSVDYGEVLESWSAWLDEKLRNSHGL
jgi:type IV secretory pathway ATPase VirB11/archaellum biosynthesis ATPase